MLKKILAVGIVVVMVIVAVVGYSLFKPPEQASGPIEAVPLTESEMASATPAPTVAATAVAAGQAATADAPAATVEPTLSPTEPANAPAVDANAIVFKLVPAESQARFIIDEVLNGSPNTVVGVTDQVAGEIAVDFSEPANSQIGTILIGARTLTTDSEMRNRTMKNRILDTNSYEFISFAPTEIIGLPDSVALGESYNIQIAGDLTVRDATHQVTFDATVTPVSETQLKGTASTTVPYRDFGLSIPNVRSVASVADDVKLELDFSAVAG